MSAHTILDGYIEALQILASQTGADRPEFERLADEKVRRLHIDNYRAETLAEAAEVAVRAARGCGESETGQYAASVAAGIGRELRRMAAAGQAPAPGCMCTESGQCGACWEREQTQAPEPQPETAPGTDGLRERIALALAQADPAHVLSPSIPPAERMHEYLPDADAVMAVLAEGGAS